MKRVSIYCVIGCCIALTGCGFINPFDKHTPLPSSQAGNKLYADTIGLLEAFTKHEELRVLFEQAANGSMPLADVTKASQFSYDKYDDGTNAYYYRDDNGKTITDDSLHVDEKTADAIRKIKELLPGVQVWMREISDGRMCVVFSIVKNTTGEDNGYYNEQLLYSSQDLFDIKQYGYMEIGEGWWFFSIPMPE